MLETITISPFIAELTQRRSEKLQQLFAIAEQNTNLLANDFLTIRDLLELTAYRDTEPLWVLLLVMHMALDEGSLCVEFSDYGLSHRLTDLLGDEDARTWSQQMLSEVQVDRFARLIGTDPKDEKPVIIFQNGSKKFFYFQKYLRSEQALSKELTKKLGADAAVFNTQRLASVVKAVLESLPVKLDLYQRLAVGLALLRNFVVVSGGPGTGKTSIVVTMLHCLVSCGFATARIALAAPTGRAAQRMTEAIRSGLATSSDEESELFELAAQTLHSLLQYSPSRGTFRRHEENPIPADVIIVDEVSMVDIELMARLLKATRLETKIVLLGDKDQLPSVDAGAVLAGLIPEKQLGFSRDTREQLGQILGEADLPEAEDASFFRDAIVVLQQNYRSQEHIREVAADVNRLDAEVIERLPVFIPPTIDWEVPEGRRQTRTFKQVESEGGCWWLPQTGIEAFHDTLEAWATHQYLDAADGEATFGQLVAQCTDLPFSDELTPHHVALLDRLFGCVSRSRLLTLVRESAWGCVDINGQLDRLLRPKLDRGSRGALFAGAPVLVTRNDHIRKLYNGDVGVTLRTPKGGYRAVFPRQGRYVSLPVEALPPHELGFALTVHKSQGSEYGQVLVVVPPTGAKSLLTKEIVYTAITRAKELAILCSNEEALRLAVSRRVVRESGMPWHSGS